MCCHEQQKYQKNVEHCCSLLIISWETRRKISDEKTFSVNNESSEILKHIDQYNQVQLYKKNLPWNINI